MLKTKMYTSLDRNMLVTALYGTIFLFLMLSCTYTHATDCTASQKRQANNQLKTIESDTSKKQLILEKHMPFGIHENQIPTNGERVLYQNGYVMLHDEDLKTSLWSSYQLTSTDRAHAAGKPRINCFRTDPRFKKSQTASKPDYDEAIYDQGHMTNDADLKDNLLEQINTYVMSNMSPQHCRFNRGIWLSLEYLTRIWASDYKSIYVTSGAIFDRDNKDGRDLDVDTRRMESRNNNSRVGVPSHYYKVILRKEGTQWHSVAFLLEHTNDEHGVKWKDVKPHLKASITSIENIEAKASVQLHPKLNRSKLKQHSSGSDWNLFKGKSNLAGSLIEGKKCVDTQPL